MHKVVKMDDFKMPYDALTATAAVPAAGCDAEARTVMKVSSRVKPADARKVEDEAQLVVEMKQSTVAAAEKGVATEEGSREVSDVSAVARACCFGAYYSADSLLSTLGRVAGSGRQTINELILEAKRVPRGRHMEQTENFTRTSRISHSCTSWLLSPRCAFAFRTGCSAVSFESMLGWPWRAGN